MRIPMQLFRKFGTLTTVLKLKGKLIRRISDASEIVE